MDDHWRPISSTCAVCVMDYNFIINFDRLQVEQSHMIKALDIQDKVSLGWENKSPAHDDFQYLKMLSDIDIDRLFQLYKDDFRLFDFLA